MRTRPEPGAPSPQEPLPVFVDEGGRGALEGAAATQITDGALALAHVDGLRAGIVVLANPAVEHLLDQNCDLPCGGGDRFGLPVRPARRRYKAPRAVGVLPATMAAMRRVAAARLAETGVRELITRPPVILLLGASVSPRR